VDAVICAVVAWNFLLLRMCDVTFSNSQRSIGELSRFISVASRLKQKALNARSDRSVG
jgi:hypothetical protein